MGTLQSKPVGIMGSLRTSGRCTGEAVTDAANRSVVTSEVRATMSAKEEEGREVLKDERD